jgi:carboxypeptidase C (cathepsin A)
MTRQILRPVFASFLTFSSALLLASAPLRAADSPAKPGQDKAAGASDKKADDDSSAEPKLSITEHTAVIGGKSVKYKATAGYIILKSESDGGDDKSKDDKATDKDGLKAKAKIFFIAYTLEGKDSDRAKRPLTFSLNGGPGAASVWLHLGALGPRRVNLTELGEAPPPPYQLVDNESSWLDSTDLVFIDPVSTGYSRPEPGTKADEYHNFENDIASIAEFIRLYVTRNERWLSPKFLVGESYGTTRAAALADYLQDKDSLYLNGIVLVSSVLDFQTISFAANNDTPFPLFLPSYATAAWYHKRLPDDLQSQSLDDVRKAAADFADHDYRLALAQGDALSDDDKAAIAAKLSTFTGLPAPLIAKRNLRITPEQFFTDLLMAKDRSIGRYDSRYTGIRDEPGTEDYGYDPSFEAVNGPFSAAINSYLRGELKFVTDLKYQTLTNVFPWDWSPAENRYVNVADDLRQAMSRNPYLKVWVCTGLYDLATPYHAAEYSVHQMNLDPEIRGNIKLTYYPAGHMLYTVPAARQQLKTDFLSFLRDSTNQLPIHNAARPE